MKNQHPLVKLAGKMPAFITVALLSLLYTILSEATSANELLRNAGVVLPIRFLLVVVLGSFIVEFIYRGIRLQRNRAQDFLEQVILSTRFAALLVAINVAVIATAILACREWQSYWKFPSSPTAVSVYVDKFQARGMEKWNIQRSVLISLQRELADLEVPITVDTLPTPPEGFRNQREVLEWACDGGANVVIYGAADGGHVWPEIRICGKTAIRADLSFSPFETELSLRDMEQFSGMDELRLCLFMDSAVTQRIDYLACFALGLVFFYQEGTSESAHRELKIAEELFTKALSYESTLSACDLNYCKALLMLGSTKYHLALESSYGEQLLRELQDADSCFEEAILRDSLFHEAWASWGLSQLKQARAVQQPSSVTLFQSAAAKLGAASHIAPSSYATLVNWGNALQGLAALVDDTSRLQLYNQAVERFRAAVAYKPNVGLGHLNWAMCEAQRISFQLAANGKVSASDLVETLGRFDEGIRLRPEATYHYSDQANVLATYAVLYGADSTSTLFHQCFEKYVRALNDYPILPEALHSWAISAWLYLSTNERYLRGEAVPWYIDSLKAFECYSGGETCYRMLAEYFRLASDIDPVFARYSKFLIDNFERVRKRGWFRALPR